MIFTLCSCDSSEKITPKTQFLADYVLSYNEMQVKGTIKTFEGDSAEISVVSPESLNGFSAVVKDDVFSINYKSMSVSYEKDDLPDGAFFKMILASLDLIRDSEDLNFEKTDDGYSAVIENSLGDIQISLNKEFFIKTIRIANQGFYLELEEK
ncbi:MAG: hypothetical protein IIU65_02915 [Clostridia bacterium]|nr:hypothetical protein [Clostridia bacterium]